MPARPSRPRRATGRSLADTVARNVERMGAGPQTVYAEVPGLKYFHAVPVRLLRDFGAKPDDMGKARTGDIAEVQLVPTGNFYLSAYDRHLGETGLICMDAVDGVDFDFVNERL